ADAAPGRPLRPERAAVQPLHGRVADLVLVEARVEGDDAGVGVADHRAVGVEGVVGPGRRRGASQRGGGQGRTAVEGEGFAGHAGLRVQRGRNFTHTGVGTSTTVPVGFSAPVAASMRKTTMLSPRSLATSRYWPVGSMPKLRGRLILSAWWPAGV